jgi:hypothetical protein
MSIADVLSIRERTVGTSRAHRRVESGLVVGSDVVPVGDVVGPVPRIGSFAHVHAVWITLLVTVGALVTGCVVVPTGSHVFVVPRSIPSDCSVNVSAKLNAWLASVPDNSVLLFAGGCYRIDQTLVLTDRHNLNIYGQQATFKTDDPTGDGSTLAAPSKAARTRDHWRLVGGSNINIHDLTVRGANPRPGVDYVAALEAQHGFDIQGTTTVELARVTVEAVYGDFVYWGLKLDGNKPPVWSSGRLHDSHLDGNGRQGVSLAGAHDVLIDHNSIEGVRRSTFDLEPNGGGWGVENAVIADNDVGTGQLSFVASIGNGPVNNISILQNHLTNKAMTVVVDNQQLGAPRRHDWIVADNTTDLSWGTTPPAGMMTFRHVDRVTVTGNTAPVQAIGGSNVPRGDSFVSLGKTSAAIIKGNSVVYSTPGVDDQGDNRGLVNCGNQIVPHGPFDQPSPCSG